MALIPLSFLAASGIAALSPLTVDYLTIAGGGGGGNGGLRAAGGGGAGGYRTSAGTSGGNSSAESQFLLAVATNYTVTVGAGGAVNVAGSNSVFSTITSTGGGLGGLVGVNGGAGGSGGGAGEFFNGGGGAGTSGQGSNGGAANNAAYNSGGGGGAGAVGEATNVGGNGGGDGGAGLSSSITGSAVTRAGGGGGGSDFDGPSGAPPAGAGGAGGGGRGAQSGSGAVGGTINTGGGGGGGAGNGGSSQPGAAGGSGVVIIRYPSTFQITGGAGLTFSTAIVGANRVTTFTAGTGNIQFTEIPSGAYHLLESVVLTGSQASVTFSNLVSKYSVTYQHLQVRMVALHSAEQNARLRMNGDSGSSYNWHSLFGNGSSAGAFGTTDSWIQCGYGPNSATIPVISVIDVIDPFEPNKHRVVRTLTGSSSVTNNARLMSGVWRSTAQVDSLEFAEVSGSYRAGTRFSLYGIRGL